MITTDFVQDAHHHKHERPENLKGPHDHPFSSERLEGKIQSIPESITQQMSIVPRLQKSMGSNLRNRMSNQTKTDLADLPRDYALSLYYGNDRTLCSASPIL